MSVLSMMQASQLCQDIFNLFSCFVDIEFWGQIEFGPVTENISSWWLDFTVVTDLGAHEGSQETTGPPFQTFRFNSVSRHCLFDRF